MHNEDVRIQSWQIQLMQYNFRSKHQLDLDNDSMHNIGSFAFFTGAA